MSLMRPAGAVHRWPEVNPITLLGPSPPRPACGYDPGCWRALTLHLGLDVRLQRQPVRLPDSTKVFLTRTSPNKALVPDLRRARIPHDLDKRLIGSLGSALRLTHPRSQPVQHCSAA